jgi:long-chain acyl-CoA synthetase
MDRPWYQHYDAQVPHTLTYPDVPMHHLLEETARRLPNQTATVFFGAKLAYAQLNAQADRLAVALRNLGLEKGDRVAIVLPNCPQFVIAYYAILKAGGVVVPTNPTYKAREIEYQLKDAGARMVITLNMFMPAIQEVRESIGLQHIIVTEIKEYLPPVLGLLYPIKERREKTAVHVAPAPGIVFWPELMRAPTLPLPPVAISPDDLALLQYTGGTTGVSKGAMLTHRNMVANTVQCRYWLYDMRTDGGEVSLAAIPFFHVYGMTTSMSLAVYVGATMVLLPRFQIKDVLKAIQKYRPTQFPGVPTMYIALSNAPDVGKYNLRSIKACISGAAPLPVEVAQRFEEITGGRVVEGYGLTEASPVTHCNPLYGERIVGSIGVPYPDVDAKVVDMDTHADLPQGEIGELAIRGPQVMRGYWNRAEESAAVLSPDGWLFTGDIARMDDAGYFYIVDRKKDLIIAGGFNVYPREVEEVLYEHPKVQEAVVCGVPDPYRGESVKAYIVLKPGEMSTAEEIIAFCKERLANYKVPRQVDFRETLPKSIIGKHIRRILREEEAARRAAAPAEAGELQTA